MNPRDFFHVFVPVVSLLALVIFNEGWVAKSRFKNRFLHSLLMAALVPVAIGLCCSTYLVSLRENYELSPPIAKSVLKGAPWLFYGYLFFYWNRVKAFKKVSFQRQKERPVYDLEIREKGIFKTPCFCAVQTGKVMENETIQTRKIGLRALELLCAIIFMIWTTNFV